MCKCYSFYVQLISYDLLIEFREVKISLHIHLSNGLTVLDVRRIPARTAHNDQLKHLIHIGLQLLVDPGLIHLREITQMDTLRRICIDTPYQILVDILRHERDHRRRRLACLHKCGIERHISIDLILLHSLSPEALAASSYIPVAHIIHKILQSPCRLWNPVILKMAVHILDQRVEPGQKPLIHNR